MSSEEAIRPILAAIDNVMLTLSLYKINDEPRRLKTYLKEALREVAAIRDDVSQLVW